MKNLNKYLQGGDLRSIGEVDQLVPLIQNHQDFDQLFKCLFSNDRLIAMRAVDAIEKITSGKPEYLDKHKEKLIKILDSAENKEFKWHLALLTSRLNLSRKELSRVWKKLLLWVKDQSESKIVRVNSLQALFDLSRKYEYKENDLASTMEEIKKEKIPSINARIKKLT